MLVSFDVLSSPWLMTRSLPALLGVAGAVTIVVVAVDEGGVSGAEDVGRMLLTGTGVLAVGGVVSSAGLFSQIGGVAVTLMAGEDAGSGAEGVCCCCWGCVMSEICFPLD